MRLNVISVIWILLVLTASFHILFYFTPSFTEQLYGEKIFPIFRFVLDHSLALFPIPLYHISWLIAVAMLIRAFFAFFRQKEPWKARLSRFARRLISLLVVLYAIFYWFWGFNYYRPPVQQRLDINTATPDEDWLLQQFEEQIRLMNELRRGALMHILRDSVVSDHRQEEILSTSAIRAEVEKILPMFKYNNRANPVLRSLKPKGVFLHWAATGMYWPFTGEANIDQGIHLIKKPVTMAHEYAHAYGVTDEGDCNLIGYLACAGSSDALSRYSAAQSYFRYLLSAIRKTKSKEEIQSLIVSLDERVRNDMRAIRQLHSRYKLWLPDLRSKAYDMYLKGNKVSEGLRSYDRFIVTLYNLERRSSND